MSSKVNWLTYRVNLNNLNLVTSSVFLIFDILINFYIRLLLFNFGGFSTYPNEDGGKDIQDHDVVDFKVLLRVIWNFLHHKITCTVTASVKSWFESDGNAHVLN